MEQVGGFSSKSSCFGHSCDTLPTKPATALILFVNFTSINRNLSATHISSEARAHQRRCIRVSETFEESRRFPSPVRKKRTSDGSLFECGLITDYRTFYEGYLKCVGFYNWLSENRNFNIIQTYCNIILNFNR